MPRYIDVDALIENFATATKAFMTDKYFFNVEEIKAYMELIGKIIMSQPTVDVIEVVRCKNCSKKEYCRTSNAWAFPPSDNWFCADGERKPTMTNRDYIETLSDNELARYIVHKLPNIWMQYNNSELGLSSWLAKERREE